MSFDKQQFRHALGRFATGVCVITAKPHGYGALGLTVNSFASVSLTPPLVLWSLRKTSHTMDAFAVTTQFCVNVLSQEQQLLSARLARTGEHALDEQEFFLGKSGVPVLRGALASFECDVNARHDGGDHIILIGLVRELHVPASGRALLYYQGAYAEIG